MICCLLYFLWNFDLFLIIALNSVSGNLVFSWTSNAFVPLFFGYCRCCPYQFRCIVQINSLITLYLFIFIYYANKYFNENSASGRASIALYRVLEFAPRFSIAIVPTVLYVVSISTIPYSNACVYIYIYMCKMFISFYLYIAATWKLFNLAILQQLYEQNNTNYQQHNSNYISNIISKHNSKITATYNSS